MRHWKIIGALVALLGEGALQLSGYTSWPLAITLGIIMVGLIIWSAWPTLKVLRLQKPLKFRKTQIYKEKGELQTQLNIVSGRDVTVLEPTLSIDIQEIEFCVSGDPNCKGYPLGNSEVDKARWLRILIYFDGNVFVETLGLVISGKEPIPANEWKPRHVDYVNFYGYFRVPDWVKLGEQRTIQLIAFANGKNWGSREAYFNFPTK